MKLRFAGFGGQGVVLCGFIFGKAAMFEGKNSIHTQSYGSASRGGLTKSDVAIESGEIYDLIQDCVNKVNQDLSQDSRLGNSQIRRFLILHKELDADDGELTRTRKVRRKFVLQRYEQLVDGLYGDRETLAIEADIRYKDGTAYRMKTRVRIKQINHVESK